MYCALTIPNIVFTSCVSHLIAFTAQECENIKLHSNTGIIIVKDKRKYNRYFTIREIKMGSCQ